MVVVVAAAVAIEDVVAVIVVVVVVVDRDRATAQSVGPLHNAGFKKSSGCGRQASPGG